MWGDSSSWKSDVRFNPIVFLPMGAESVLVDVGCGTGELASFLRRNKPGVKYIGVEAVPEFAAEARTRQGVEVHEIDAFTDPEQLPEADWYVSFGTMNKQWSISNLKGSTDEEKIFGYFDLLYQKARVGVAVSLTTSVVDFLKPGVCNMSPEATASHLSSLSPHFFIYHGYPLYEFFCAAWRGTRGSREVNP